MVKEWYRVLGFRKNPLHLDPTFNDPLFGYDALLEELFERIESGNLIYLEGKESKTAILTKIVERYKGKGKVAYINCEKVKDEPDIKVVLANGKKKLQLRSTPKNMIILLDNVTQLSMENAEKIKYYFDQGNILSIIMTGTDFMKTKIPESLKHRVGKRVYQLKELTKDESVDIVQERLGFHESLREDQIMKLTKKTKGIKQLFKECESALFIMANQKEDQVSDSIIERLLENKNEMV